MMHHTQASLEFLLDRDKSEKQSGTPYRLRLLSPQERQQVRQYTKDGLKWWPCECSTHAPDGRCLGYVEGRE